MWAAECGQGCTLRGQSAGWASAEQHHTQLQKQTQSTVRCPPFSAPLTLQYLHAVSSPLRSTQTRSPFRWQRQPAGAPSALCVRLNLFRGELISVHDAHEIIHKYIAFLSNASLYTTTNADLKAMVRAHVSA